MSKLQDRLDRIKKGFVENAPAHAQSVMVRATEELRASGILAGIPAVGSKLPAFELVDTTGECVRSGELLAKGPLVVTFYRGFW